MLPGVRVTAPQSGADDEISVQVQGDGKRKEGGPGAGMGKPLRMRLPSLSLGASSP